MSVYSVTHSSALLQNMDEFTRLSVSIFNSIFAHRYKDFNASIRAHCTKRLGRWLLTDPVRMFEDTYLKYLGWMCSDRAPNVRLEAIDAISNLCDDVNSTSLLESFLDRFVMRILEMAASDADESVALVAISCLQKLQRFGALDEVDSGAISQVDAIVFDSECSANMRAAALLFMMEHTEGFEFLLASSSTELGTTTSSAKHGKKKDTKRPASNLGARRNVLLALETLTEFMDDVYKSKGPAAEDIDDEYIHNMSQLLVSAFEALPANTLSKFMYLYRRELTCKFNVL